jgi:hypothetical protein
MNKTSAFIDLTLTPATAKKGGMEYTGDILYEPEGKNNALIKELVEEGNKLGQPQNTKGASEHIKSVLYGVYQPLTEGLLFLRSIKPDLTLTPENAKEKGYEWDHQGWDIRAYANKKNL